MCTKGAALRVTIKQIRARHRETLCRNFPLREFSERSILD
jgi:hypothetical protein